MFGRFWIEYKLPIRMAGEWLQVVIAVPSPSPSLLQLRTQQTHMGLSRQDGEF